MLHVEPEPHTETLKIYATGGVVVDGPDVVEQWMPLIEAGFRAMGGPCYVLVDITNIQLRPGVRTYLAARGQITALFMRALVVFSRRNPITELLLRIGAEYSGVPYAYAPDEATARAIIATYRASLPSPPDFREPPV